MPYVFSDLPHRWFFVASVSLALSSCFAAEANAQLLPGPRVTIEPRGSVPKQDETRPNIRVDSNLVLIPVTVTDGKSRFVTGLSKEYFKIFENEREQAISHFAIEDAPISVGIVFDCSSSMGSRMKWSREAVAHFFRSAGRDDEFLLVTFSSRPQLALGFTDYTERIQNELSLAAASGNTALIDAIQLALAHMRGARNTRKAILIVSDGADNASRYSMGEIKKIVRESDVQVFAIAMVGLDIPVPSLFDAFGVGLLSDISTETGGKAFEARSLKDLPRIASKIGVALRTQYVLGYVPEESTKDGKFHRVKVRLAQSVPKEKLRLSWRMGYYAPSE